MSEWRQQLRAVCRGHILDASSQLAARARDFGGMCERMPTLVVQPACVEDVQWTVRLAGEHGLTLTVRGAGHSQSGQGLSTGLILDMTSLRRVLTIDREALRLEAEAGATWRSVVDATYAQGLLPVGLTHALDTTLGGTLNIGGVGAESLHCGPQVDNVLYLDVVTTAGELVRCSGEQEAELFDLVRAGLGQCGIIVRVGYPVRPAGRSMHTRAFVYRELNDLLADAAELASTMRPGRHLAVRLGSDPLRSVGLVAAMFIGHEREHPDRDEDEALPTLRHGFEPPSQLTPTFSADGVPGHPFFRVFAGSDLSTGPEPNKNPWVDLLFTLPAAAAALAALGTNPGGVLGHGPAGAIFVRRGVRPAPLLVLPDAEITVGIGVYPTLAANAHERAASVAYAYLEAMRTYGGKRYLCGYFDPSKPADWGAHYAAVWPWFCAAKAKHDPRGLLASGLIRWPND